MKSSKKAFELNITEDGTYTLYINEYGENTHDYHGAYEEAFFKHILPMLDSQANRGKRSLNLLDVGFGLGYNILATLSEAEKRGLFVKIVSLEKEKAIGSLLSEISFGDHRDLLYASVLEAFNTGAAKGDFFEIEVLLGEARDSIKRLKEEGLLFDGIYQDAHSPGKNSELWSVEWFSTLANLLSENSFLTTYSSAVHVRSALIEAGFVIGPNISDHFKKEGTVAANQLFAGAFDPDYEEELKLNIKATPFHDNTDLSLSRSKIFDLRLAEMERKRKGL